MPHECQRGGGSHTCTRNSSPSSLTSILVSTARGPLHAPVLRRRATAISSDASCDTYTAASTSSATIVTPTTSRDASSTSPATLSPKSLPPPSVRAPSVAPSRGPQGHFVEVEHYSDSSSDQEDLRSRTTRKSSKSKSSHSKPRTEAPPRHPSTASTSGKGKSGARGDTRTHPQAGV